MYSLQKYKYVKQLDIFTRKLDRIPKNGLTKTSTNLEWSNTETKILQYWYIYFNMLPMQCILKKYEISDLSLTLRSF